MTRFPDQATHAFNDWERETKSKRYQYWQMLRRAKTEFIKITEQASIEYDMGDGAFYYYMQMNYGIKVELIDDKIAGDYVIVDEKKHLLFLLKFGQ